MLWRKYLEVGEYKLTPNPNSSDGFDAIYEGKPCDMEEVVWGHGENGGPVAHRDDILLEDGLYSFKAKTDIESDWDIVVYDGKIITAIQDTGGHHCHYRYTGSNQKAINALMRRQLDAGGEIMYRQARACLTCLQCGHVERQRSHRAEYKDNCEKCNESSLVAGQYVSKERRLICKKNISRYAGAPE